MIKIIDSRTNPYIKYVEKLKNTSFSKEERKFFGWKSSSNWNG